MITSEFRRDRSQDISRRDADTHVQSQGKSEIGRNCTQSPRDVRPSQRTLVCRRETKLQNTDRFRAVVGIMYRHRLNAEVEHIN